ncbi:unnamed protein product [Diamesa serratosioi]
MDEIPLNIKIKQEKLTPPRVEPKDDVDKLLDLKLFESENEEKKNVTESKTSNELLAELFMVFGASVPDTLNNSNGDGKHKKKKKEKKESKRKHDDESKKEKHKKSKKSKKIKQEPKDDEAKKEVKKERKSEEKVKEPEKKKIQKIVFKDLHKSSVFNTDSSKATTTTTTTSSKTSSSTNRGNHEKDRDQHKEKEKEKDKKAKDRKHSDSKTSGNISEVSLSDEETYRHLMEYHTSTEFYNDKTTRRGYSREREREREQRPVREWDRDKYPRRRSQERYEHTRSRYNDYGGRPRSRSRSSRRSPIDKKKLLEIARKNAITMLKRGSHPRGLSENSKEKLITKIKHGGKSIEELTNYCKRLSNAEELGELSSLSEDSDHDGEGKERAFHHPFEVKDRGPIVMNIRNSVPIPPKPAGALKAIMSQFPVSSGKQHLAIESWQPVQTTPAPTTTVSTIPPAIIPLPKQPAGIISINLMNIDVSSIISQRLNAMRKLQDNPHDNEASRLLHDTQQNMSAWAHSKYTPGQFLGSTDVRVLSAKELASGSQAWARKNQLIDTQPVTSGMGMHLLKKMGWAPGEGLGKEKNGSLQPLLLELKLDKRGLEANDESQRQKNNRSFDLSNSNRVLEQKHPVSLLGELASKRHWGLPQYDLISEKGPAHAKNFIFKIRLNGMEYQCSSPANNKKEGKAIAAKFCLQQLGILPSS